jgi:glycosyltransferase involved in cell wall biosynthesis
MQTQKAMRFHSWALGLSAGVIPTSFDYSVGYKGCRKLTKVVPLPLDPGPFTYTDNRISNSKIRIFHGLNRYGYKGTRHIERALQVLQSRYPARVEVNIVGRIPLNQYLELLKDANIVIDQTHSQYIGMNALQGMAMGKVVLSGSEQVALEAIGVDTCPVVNIVANSSDIVSKLEEFIHDPSKLLIVGEASREYVERVHGHVAVASQYLGLWGLN